MSSARSSVSPFLILTFAVVDSSSSLSTVLWLFTIGLVIAGAAILVKRESLREEIKQQFMNQYGMQPNEEL